MSIKTFVLPLIVAAMPLTLLGGPGSVSTGIAGFSHGSTATFWNSCYAYNRDGVTCWQVGYVEGQRGAPWGEPAGQFLCVNSCLKWIGP